MRERETTHAGMQTGGKHAEAARDATAADLRAAHAASVAALRLAFVHLVRAEREGVLPSQRCGEPDDDEELPEDQVAFRYLMARRIATFLGRHDRCSFPACRRARRCMGDPPDCFRDEPPASPDEQAYAMAEVSRALKQRLGLG